MFRRIKNWSKFQHFKDRRPPWIKLYRELLDDVEFHELDGDSAKTLMMLWLIASENEGMLPEIKTLAFRLRTTEKTIKTHLSRLSKWLEQDDIGAISDRYQDDSPETETERETEVEKETEKSIATKDVAFREPALHVKFVEGFQQVYQEMTGAPFKIDRKHWVIAATLVKQYGYDPCVLKARTLGALCRDRAAWFTKEGLGSFNLETLSSKWNNIIPQAMQPSKEDELRAEIKKREEMRVRSDAIVNGSSKVANI